MIKLWMDGAIRVQKFAIVFMLVLFFLPAQAFVSHSFVPSQTAKEFAHFVAIGLTVFFLFLMYYVRKVSPVKANLPYSGIKKVLVAFSIPFFVYGCAWVNIAVSVPQLYTLVFGHSQTYLGYAVKAHKSSKRSCDYMLKPTGVDFILFHYCISYGQYAGLPDSEFEVQLVTKSSFLGTHYDEIKVNAILR